jgi:hypothetical protein
MGLIYRRRIRTGRHLWTNVSTHGVSESFHAGPVTVNTRGRLTVRLLKD